MIAGRHPRQVARKRKRRSGHFVHDPRCVEFVATVPRDESWPHAGKCARCRAAGR